MPILANPYDKMFENRIMTASREDLTLMLYDGAVKFCNQAITAIEKKEIENATNLIIRVEDIIREFQITLDKSYEISTYFNKLYDYMYRRLVEGNMAKDAEIIKEVRDLIREMRDTWKEAMKLAKQ